MSLTFCFFCHRVGHWAGNCSTVSWGSAGSCLSPSGSGSGAAPPRTCRASAPRCSAASPFASSSRDWSESQSDDNDVTLDIRCCRLSKLSAIMSKLSRRVTADVILVAFIYALDDIDDVKLLTSSKSLRWANQIKDCLCTGSWPQMLLNRHYIS